VGGLQQKYVKQMLRVQILFGPQIKAFCTKPGQNGPGLWTLDLSKYNIGSIMESGIQSMVQSTVKSPGCVLSSSNPNKSGHVIRLSMYWMFSFKSLHF